MAQAEKDLTDIIRGDTREAQTIIEALKVNGVRQNIVSGRMQIRDKTTNAVIFEWNTEAPLSNATLSSSESDATNDNFTIDALSAEDSNDFALGNKQPYDVELTLDDGRTKTWLKGTVPIIKDITRTDA